MCRAPVHISNFSIFIDKKDVAIKKAKHIITQYTHTDFTRQQCGVPIESAGLEIARLEGVTW